MIKWKDPRIELPKQGQFVAVVRQQNKEHNQLSCEIMLGEVSIYTNGDVIVQTNDMTGSENYFSIILNNYDWDEKPVAWCDWKELNFPDFISHNDWLEKIK